jgi:hypothetical protein
MELTLVFKNKRQVHAVAASGTSLAHFSALSSLEIVIAQTAAPEQLTTLCASRGYVAGWLLPSGKPLCNATKVQQYLAKKNRVAVASQGRLLLIPDTMLQLYQSTSPDASLPVQQAGAILALCETAVQPDANEFDAAVAAISAPETAPETAPEAAPEAAHHQPPFLMEAASHEPACMANGGSLTGAATAAGAASAATGAKAPRTPAGEGSTSSKAKSTAKSPTTAPKSKPKPKAPTTPPRSQRLGPRP